jgi:hypothetical protein
MMKRNFLKAVGISLALGMAFAACEHNGSLGGGGNSVVYTSTTEDGKPMVLTITKAAGNANVLANAYGAPVYAVYVPQSGDSYTITIAGALVSSGTVSISADKQTLTFRVNGSSTNTFKASFTANTGATLTFDPIIPNDGSKPIPVKPATTTTPPFEDKPLAPTTPATPTNPVAPYWPPYIPNAPQPENPEEPVAPGPTSVISLSVTGTHRFTRVIGADYEAPDALNVTITNTGAEATETLTVAVSNQNAFTVSQPTPSSITANNGTAAFTVVPKTGLTKDTYTATVTVSGTNVDSQTFDVSFTVLPSADDEEIYDIRLDPETWEFPPAIFGYGEQTAKTVTVKNEGNVLTGDLTVSTSADLEVAKASDDNYASSIIISSINISTSDSFKVRPKTGLAVAHHNGTVTVSNTLSGNQSISKEFTVSFEVEAARYGIELSQTEMLDFGTDDVGYAAPTPRTVSVRNTGNVPTGDLTISLNGSTNFEITTPTNQTIATIPVDGEATFTITPATNLSASATPYTATVTVGNANVIPSVSFDVSFTVVIPYGVRLAPEEYTFMEAYVGYDQQASAPITIYNTGSHPTGNLTAYVGADFEITTPANRTINSIPINGEGSFSVRPKTGLAAGLHIATITILNNDITSRESVALTFNVKPPIIYEPSVQKLFTNSEPSQTVELSGLGGNSVYIVKVNTGASNVAAASTGSVTSSSLSDVTGQSASSGAAPLQSGAAAPAISGPVSGIFRDRNGQLIYRYEPQHKEPEVMPPFQHRSAAQKSGALQNMTAAVQSNIGDIGMFWVANSISATSSNRIYATLRATGTHSNIWVAENNADYPTQNNYSEANADYYDNKITLAQAQEMADKFDIIYEKETALFGFEYGGGLATTDPNYGGVDGDPKIQILVHDIYGDYVSGQSGGTFGFFLGNDEYRQSSLQSPYKSNEMEIFYIDAHFADRAPEAIYSALAHEFQHMIHFNRKRLGYNLSTDTWYNEMLSMLAEDVIDPFIGIDANATGHPIADRIPRFLGHYSVADLTDWLTGDNVYLSYSNAYAFGAYLVRNFGGAKLIQELMSNNAKDAASITAALDSAANPRRSEVASFEEALRRYGEALVFSQPAEKRPPGVLSFNNTVTDNISGNDYTFTGFDIWNIRKVVNNYYDTLGPYVFDPNTARDMPGRTMLLQSKTAWQGKSGSLSITVQKPASSDIEVYVMVR